MKLASALTATAAALSLAACATMDDTVYDNDPVATEPAPSRLTAQLTGAAEAPGPGDADGYGSFQATLTPNAGQLCYELDVTGVEMPTAAHIHTGAAGVAGGVAVALETPADGDSDGCVTMDASLANAINANPGGYYVNVHNAAYPNGAIRGQLTR